MLMARDLARCFDPVMLARDCGIEPDAWQAKLLTERPSAGSSCVPDNPVRPRRRSR